VKHLAKPLAPWSQRVALRDRHRLLGAAVFLTIACAPLEGYLVLVSPVATKVPSIFLLVAWACHLVRSRRMPALTSTSLLLLTLGMEVLISSSVNSGNPYTFIDVFRWIPFILLGICLIDFLCNAVDPRTAIAGAVVGALACSAGALFSFFYLHDPRAVGPLPDSNDLAYVLISTLPFVLFAPPSFMARSVVKFSVASLMVAALGATLSRGALVAACVGLAWVAVRRLASTRVVLAVVTIAGLGAVVLTAVPHSNLKVALDQKRFIAQTNVDTRVLRWEAAARMLSKSPIFGTGPGGVKAHYVQASNNAELALPQPPVTHNMYLQVAADLGLIGLILFFGLIVAAFVLAHSAERGTWRSEAIAVQASIITLAVASIFLSEQFYMPLWLAISLAAALHQRDQTEGGGIG